MHSNVKTVEAVTVVVRGRESPLILGSPLSVGSVLKRFPVVDEVRLELSDQGMSIYSMGCGDYGWRAAEQYTHQSPSCSRAHAHML